MKMDVFLMIRRHKMTVFLDAKENTSVLELMRMIEGITKKPPTEQRLYNKDDVVSFFCSLFFFIDQSDFYYKLLLSNINIKSNFQFAKGKVRLMIYS